MKLALSTLDANNEEFLKNCREAGIHAVEISVASVKGADSLNFPELKAFSEKYGVELLSFHLPFDPFGIIDPSVPELADHTITYFCSLIDKAAAVGIRVFVIHASGEPIEDADRKQRMECAKHTLFALAEYAKKYDAVIAVEDLPRTCLGHNSAEIEDLISAHPNLRVCFDTNHLLSEKDEDFVKKLGSKIITTHISDYDMVDEKHWLPGEGLIDWASLKSALEEVGYNGPWLYELRLCGSMPTIDRPRSLDFSDIRHNYEEITSGYTPTPIGTPKKFS